MNVLTFPDAKQGGGFYSTAEVAKYLRMRSALAVRNWVFGDTRSEPVINRQYAGSRTDLGFYDLLEVRFIDYFRRNNVSLQSIRKAAAAARKDLRQAHPFATSTKKFVTDRREIFLCVAEELKDRHLVELTTGQLAFYDIVEQSLAKGVEFDPNTDLARAWKPDPDRFPAIELTPHYAFGHPVVARSHIPTRVLFDTYRAEGNSVAAAADWYEVAEDLVREAIEFEIVYAAEVA